MSATPTAMAPAPADDRRARLSAWAQALVTHGRASFARHRWLAALIGVYFLGAAAVEWHFTRSIGTSFQLYTATCIEMIAIMAVAILMIHAVYVMVAIRPRQLFRELGRRYRTSLFRAERIANALPVLLLLPIFFNSFTVLKTSVPRVAPFAWDAAFEKADLWLHGGVAPWTLLQPWFERHLQAPHFVDLAYVLWFFVLWLVVVWQIFSLRLPGLRARFLGTLVLCWVLLGTFGSFLFASAGPCYFGRVTGLADPYTPLMTYLRQADRVAEVWSLQTQDMLWSYYAGQQIGFGGGISAMPSMHVAMAFLLVLLASRLHWLLGVGAFVYYLAIQIGSVQLGWHYAVDGYASTIATGVLWWAVGRAVDWHAAPGAAFEAAASHPAA
jgi:PAP2 superfamily